MTATGLTPMENQVIEAIKRLNDCGCDAWIEDIEDETEIDGRKLRGVLSSLIKKGKISVNEDVADIIDN